MGLIRTTLTAMPGRGRVLAAKAAVVGAVAFVTGAAMAAVAVPLGEHILTGNGVYVFPASPLTVLRIIAGSGGLAGVTAVAVLAAERIPTDDGHGLGLAIVRAIATAHGATLTAQPRPEGGLHVELSFPAPAESPNGT